ncbi:hypothetical protein V7124_02005 [Neobacillus niacini]|uniref:hypothetical protein n=1 Tax=Neobacillus niacini TaxID=86668 RepID=UPI003000C3E9
MKKSNQSIEKLTGIRKRARHKQSESHSFMHYFRKPIVHREIHGDRIYVPLRINRVWDGI